jgi:hypothetical protein
MSTYIDRLREAAYTSPSGLRYALQFDDLERSGGKKAAISELPQQNTASVQDLGNQAERYPMSIYFVGDNYDIASDALWSALSEKGPGTLQHSRYGDILVLPITWSCAEKFVDGIGRVDYRIEFIKVQENTIFPITSTNTKETVFSTVENELNESITENAEQFTPENSADLAGVIQTVVAAVQGYYDRFAPIVAEAIEIATLFEKTVNELLRDINAISADPTKLYGYIVEIAKIPSLADVPIIKKVQAYYDSLVSISTIPPETTAQAATSTQSILSIFGASSISSTIGSISNRGEAKSIIDKLESIQAIVQQSIEGVEDIIPEYKTPVEVLSNLIDSASMAKSSIINNSFGLKTEKRLILPTERTPLDLITELYGESIDNIDALLDEFIVINNLQGNEISIIPSGREVVYYV